MKALLLIVSSFVIFCFTVNAQVENKIDEKKKVERKEKIEIRKKNMDQVRIIKKTDLKDKTANVKIVNSTISREAVEPKKLKK